VLLGVDWRPMYRFDLQRQQAIDYEMANHYVTTHANSLFRSVLMAGRAFEGGRHALRNNVLTTYAAGSEAVERRFADASALRESLTETFGLRVPESPELDAAFERLTAASAV
jgi:N-hydroxyarylamine O-acetyltransferase